MALKMICSHWLVCGWMLTLIAGTGVAIFQRYAYPARFSSLQWSFPALKKAKWDGGWSCYAKIHGQMEDERMRIGRSDHRGVADTWRGEDGSGWSYA